MAAQTVQGSWERSAPGTCFRAGKLFDFRRGYIRILAGWPRIRAWEKRADDPRWVGARPELHVPRGSLGEGLGRLSWPADPTGQLYLPTLSPLREDRDRRRRLAWLHWYDTVPGDVRELVAAFPERQWHMLSFLARCGAPARDLTVANPALAFALASARSFHRPPVQRPLRAARTLLATGRRQRDILRWLGFPPTEAARKALMKLAVGAIRVKGLYYLRRGMADAEVMKAIGHLPRLNAGVIRIVTDPELFGVVSPTFLLEVAHRPEEEARPRAAYALQDTVRMFRLQQPEGRAFPAVGSLERLQGLHDSLMGNLHRLQDHLAMPDFPPPPVEGTDSIVPLTAAGDLVAEGREQRNCVASYIDRVAMARQVYIYRVLAPERCTLSLVRRGGRWTLAELRRHGNQAPSVTTFEAVARWLVLRGLPVTAPAEGAEAEDDDDIPF